MKFTHRITALLLAGVLLAASLLSCASGTGTDSGTSAPDTTAAPQTTEPAATEPAKTRIDPHLPEMNLDGYTMTFYGKGMNGIYAEEETGDKVNDAIYGRNRSLNEQYNFEIEHILAPNQEYAITDAQSSIQAGDNSYQVLVDGGNRYVPFIQAGLMLDLNTLKYQDFEQPWWYEYLNKGLSIKNKLYMTASAFCLTTKQQLYYISFNKDLAKDNGIDVSELYQLGRTGKWTIDKLAEYVKVGSAYLNGDGKLDNNDQWGLQLQAYSGYTLALGCGFHIADKDENDIPYITTGTENAINIWDTLCTKLFTDTSNVLVTQNIKGVSSVWTAAGEMWAGGQVLFRVEPASDGWRDYDIDYGVLPSPKLTEEQKEYQHIGSSWNTPLLGVPITNFADADKVSFILEAMAYASYYDVLPIFYENYLETKLMRDRESVEMLEIIQSTPFFDIGAVFNWGEMLSTLYTITQSGNNTLARMSAKMVTAANKQIEKAIDQIEKNSQS